MIDELQESYIDLKYRAMDQINGILDEKMKDIDKISEELKEIVGKSKSRLILTNKRIKIARQMREEIGKVLLSSNTRWEFIKAELNSFF